MDVMKKIKENIEDIAAMPHVAAKALELLNSHETSAAELSKVFELDMILTGKLLKIVNSAYYGFSTKIATVPQAIAILGYENLKSILISTIAFDLFHKNTINSIEPKGLWLHSLGTATFAQALAREMKFDKVEEYYIAGLMHDIGKVIFDQQITEDYKKIITVVRDRRMSIYDVEEQVLNTNHAEVGYYLALHWKLPKYLASSIRFHHKIIPGLDEAVMQMAAIVQLSDFFCNLQKLGDSGSKKVSLVQKETKELINISSEEKTKISQKVKEDMERAKTFFEVK